MGVLAVGVGKVLEALPFFKTALEASPATAQFWLSYLDALIKLDRLTDAKAVLDQAKINGAKGEAFDKLEQQLRGIEPNVIIASNIQDPPQDMLQPIINLYNQGQFQQALDEVLKVLHQFPNAVTLYNIQGAANAGLGQLDDAIEAYNKALAIKPDHVDAYNNMGVALQEQGKLEEAIEACNKALAIKPDYADAYSNMGNALKDQGKLEEAIEACNKALAIKPDYAEAYNNMGNALKGQGKLEEAIVIFNEALAIKPDFAEAYNNMGNALKEQGTLEEAIKAYNKALTIKPDYANAKHMLASLTGETTNSAPREYVENLFDRYASKFDHSLVEKLEYNIPKILTNLIIKEHGNGSLGSIVDLGCGTGLTGVVIKQFCSVLEGVDVSNKMLEQAKTKNVYGKLTHADILEYLSNYELDFDYFIFTDVFVYVGELSEVFRLIKARNKKPGKLVFSTEHTKKDGFHLEKSGRYCHSKSYIKSLCRKFSYSVSHYSEANLRKEKGVFLTGGLYLLDF